MSQIVTRCGNPPSRLIDGEAVLVSTQNGTASVLNLTAFRLWERIGQQASVESLIDFLCQSYEVDRQQALNDLDAFLNQLADLGLVKFN